MEMLMLPVALIATLGGMFALAFRVVRLPLGQRDARSGATRKQAPKSDPREPAQVLVNHVTEEYKRHSAALRVALDLRRSRNETEAFSRLLYERVRQAEGARKLSAFIHPAIGGVFVQWFDQTRRGIQADVVRREVEDVRAPSAPTRNLAEDRGFKRILTWMRGGPQSGVLLALEKFEREQRDHYRDAVVKAQRIAHDRNQDEARAQLVEEQLHHVRANSSLKEMLQALRGDNSTLSEATDPMLPVNLS